MRIIAGRFRRRQLAAAPGDTTRPLTDRAKEQLFERLGPFEGFRVLDVFAGTGTIGLEALSRGAEFVTFVERDHLAFSLLRQNVAMLEAEDESFCWRADVLRCSFRPKGRDDLLPFDRVFFDPPFPIAHQLRPGTPLFRAVARLARPEVTAAGAWLILRTPVQQTIELPADWQPEREMSIQGMAIAIYRKGDAAERDAGDEEE